MQTITLPPKQYLVHTSAHSLHNRDFLLLLLPRERPPRERVRCTCRSAGGGESAAATSRTLLHSAQHSSREQNNSDFSFQLQSHVQYGMDHCVYSRGHDTTMLELSMDADRTAKAQDMGKELYLSGALCALRISPSSASACSDFEGRHMIRVSMESWKCRCKTVTLEMQ